MTADAADTASPDGLPTRTLGTAGPPVSVIGLGCNNFGMKIDADATTAVVHAALDAGITHFDTAEMYGGGHSEEFLGAALGARRDEVTIATKFLPRPKGEPYEPGILARRIREGCELSLRRLGTDRIDVYYQHYPDADAPHAEALEALNALVVAGKVVHLASSNVTAEQITASAALSAEHGWAAFVATQLHWNLLVRSAEADDVPAARDAGLGVVPYFPLASGLLSGKYLRDEVFPAGTRLSDERFAKSVVSDENFDKVEKLTAFARDHGHSVLDLAFAWLLAHPEVSTVIAGATSPEQVRANAAAAGWTLAAADLRDVDTLLA